MEKEIKNNETGVQIAQPSQLNTVIGTNAKEIVSVIMDNIKKVQEDPKFIPQAEAINSQFKTLVEVAKSEIEMLKVSAFLSGGK